MRNPDSGEVWVDITRAASTLVQRLKDVHGPLMFHQSGGCCDGSAPMCYLKGEFKTGKGDVLLGVIEGCEFFMSAGQFEYWKHTSLTVDVVEGRGSGFSLEAPEGVRFIIRSELINTSKATG